MKDLPEMKGLERMSIPSMVDGLKLGQRKILFCAFNWSKGIIDKDILVSVFACHVEKNSGYYENYDLISGDDEHEISNTIIGMAQDYVGSGNNINLFQPNGVFGTRYLGGKDHEDDWCLYTRLSPITRYLFPKEDDIILKYLEDRRGRSIEPEWYIPILPMVLINGGAGGFRTGLREGENGEGESIETALSSVIPNYNPEDICRNLIRLLDGKPLKPMDPWYEGFRGDIVKTVTKEAGVIYTSLGIIEEVNETTLRITELPLGVWLEDYKIFLGSMMIGGFIKDYKGSDCGKIVHYEVTLSPENLIKAKEEGLLTKFKLTSTISTSNMHAFDTDGIIKKYNTPEQILLDFYKKRLEFYKKRKECTMRDLEEKNLKLDCTIKFVESIRKGDVSPPGWEEPDDMVMELKRNGFGDCYEYLMSLSMDIFRSEYVDKLREQFRMNCTTIQYLQKATEKSLWMTDLENYVKFRWPHFSIYHQYTISQAKRKRQKKEAKPARRKRNKQ